MLPVSLLELTGFEHQRATGLLQEQEWTLLLAQKGSVSE